MDITARAKKVAAIVARMEKLADRADKLELVLPNGGQVGSLLGTMAFDIQQVEESRYHLRMSSPSYDAWLKERGL